MKERECSKWSSVAIDYSMFCDRCKMNQLNQQRANKRTFGRIEIQNAYMCTESNRWQCNVIDWVCNVKAIDSLHWIITGSRRSIDQSISLFDSNQSIDRINQLVEQLIEQLIGLMIASSSESLRFHDFFTIGEFRFLHILLRDWNRCQQWQAAQWADEEREMRGRHRHFAHLPEVAAKAFVSRAPKMLDSHFLAELTKGNECNKCDANQRTNQSNNDRSIDSLSNPRWKWLEKFTTEWMQKNRRRKW